MRIRIHGRDLPGRSCPGGPEAPGRPRIQVGVQRRNRPAELLGLHRGDAPAAVRTLECTAKAGPDGVDLTGPCIQGGPGGRFVCLSWVFAPGDVPGAAPVLFRRAKLLLSAVPAKVAAAALDSGLLVADLSLTGAAGRPVSARVVPPQVSWAAGVSASPG
jgi:hypothetical protein